MKKRNKDNQGLLHGWEKQPSIMEPLDYQGGVTYAVPVTQPRPTDRKDPAGLWNPPTT